MFPAVYLLAARGAVAAAMGTVRVGVVRWSSGQVVKWPDASGHDPRKAGSRRPGLSATAVGLVVVMVVGLVALSNVDLAGNQQLNLWFHYSQGNAW